METPRMETDATLLVRPLRIADADAAAELCGQLGYHCSGNDLQTRIQECLDTQERVALAALLPGNLPPEKSGSDGWILAGWIEAVVERHLQSPAIVSITGLVVRDRYRGYGIGKRLCAKIEAWARAQGLRGVQVRSRTTREDAHRFYLREGYARVKTSAVFEKIFH